MINKSNNHRLTLSFTKEGENKLFSFYKQLNQYGCTYMYYTVNDPINGRIRFTTNEDWIKCYLDEDHVKHDPVKLVCEQRLNRIISWHHIPISSLNQKKVMGARCAFGLNNGLSIVKHDNTGVQKIIALATDSKSNNFTHEIFSNRAVIKEIVSEIHRLI